MLFEKQYTGRKPSKNQVIKDIKKAIFNGYTIIDIFCGENSIYIEKSTHNFYGRGWIKNISGHDIAQELSREDRRAALNLYNT
jgi:hypothetical protein